MGSRPSAGPFHGLSGTLNHRLGLSLNTSQFVVRVYPSPKGHRVVVDGISHFDEEQEDRVEPRAEEIIRQRLEAFLPHRPVPDPEPGRSGLLFFDIVLKRVPARASGASREAGRRASSTASPRPAATVVVPGRRQAPSARSRRARTQRPALPE